MSRGRITQRELSQSVNEKLNTVDSHNQMLDQINSKIQANERTLNETVDKANTNQQTLNQMVSAVNNNETVLNEVTSTVENHEETLNQIVTSIENHTGEHNTSHIPYTIDSGTDNAKTALLYPVPSAYIEGMAISFKNRLTNTGPVTMNVNNLGQKTVLKANGETLSSGELVAGSIYTIRYNGSNFILQGEGSGLTQAQKTEMAEIIGSTALPSDKTATQINKLRTAKNNIASAVNTMGVSADENDSMTDLSSKITRIVTPPVTVSGIVLSSTVQGSFQQENVSTSRMSYYAEVTGLSFTTPPRSVVLYYLSGTHLYRTIYVKTGGKGITGRNTCIATYNRIEDSGESTSLVVYEVSNSITNGVGMTGFRLPVSMSGVTYNYEIFW